MPNSALSEIYFIAAMFVLIFIICGVTVFFFFRTFQREKQAKQLEIQQKKDLLNKAENSANE